MPQSLARMAPQDLNYLDMLTARRAMPNYAAADQQGPELRAYQPSLEDQARLALQQAGMPANQAGRAAAAVPMTPMGFAYEGGRDIAQGNPVSGAARLGMALAPEVPANLLARAARAPKTMGAISGAAGLFGATPAGEAAEDDPEQIMQLQRELKAKGYYAGKIDGDMGPGTKRAKEAYEKDQAAKEKREIERAKVEAEKAKAEAALAESARKAAKAKQKAKERAAGSQRLKKLSEEESGFGQSMRRYAPLAGYVIGGAAGTGLRRLMTGAANKTSREAAAATDRLISSRGDVPKRAGGVNRFWQEGGAQTPPFKAAPRAKYGMSSNAKAPSATTLYPPPGVLAQYAKGRDVGVVGGAAAESGFSTYMAQQAHQDLQDARKAVASDPSEANIQRLQQARDAALTWEVLQNIGRGAALGYVPAAAKMPYKSVRPNVARAEAERARLDTLMSTAAKAVRKTRSKTKK